MTSFVAAVAASIFFLVVPGWAMLLAAGARGPLRGLLFAPLVSVGVVGAWGVLFQLVGVAFNTLSVIAATAIAAVAVWAVCRFVPRVGPQPDRGGERGPSGLGLALGGAMLIAGVIWVLQVVTPLAGLDAFVQPYDVPWHMAIIERILSTGDGSSLTSGLVDATQGDNKYPVAWHDGVALAAGLTGVSIPMAINASVLAITAVAWPLSLAAFAIALFGHRRSPVVLMVLLGSLFQAFPLRFVTYGVLYSNLLSYAIVPALLAAFLSLIGRRNVTGGGRGWAGILFAVGFAGVGLAQPNSVFTAAVVMIPFVIERIIVGTFTWLRTRSLAVRVSAAAAGTVGFLAIVGAVWIVLYRAPFMQRTVRFEWPPFHSFGDGMQDALTYSFNGAPDQLLLGLLVILGAVVAVLRRRHLWLVVSHAMMCGFYVITSSTSNRFRDLLTGFWYHDSNRLAAAVVFTAIPLAVIALQAAAAAVLRLWRRRDAASSIGEDALVGTAVAAVLGLVVVTATCLGPALSHQRARLSIMSQLDAGGPLTSEKLAFLEQVAAELPEGATVANQPYDGSTYAYPLLGVDVVFKSYEANWISAPLEDSVVIRDRLADAATDPAVCPVLRERGVEYALIMPITGINEPNPVGHIGYYEPNWHGLEIDASTRGFEPILQSGEMTLYRITACE